MRYMIALLLIMTAPISRAEGRAGVFDYYVMALSWSPAWCAGEGRGRGAAQCERATGWVLHGLWPQYERGWPSDCPSVERNPSRRETREQEDLFGSSGSAWHQWNKHGRCSGLSSRDYYLLAAEAYARIKRPEILRRLREPVRLPAHVIEDAFLEANPGLGPDMLTVSCRAGAIAEVRVCFTRDLEPRACSADVARDCALNDALFTPVGR